MRGETLGEARVELAQGFDDALTVRGGDDRVGGRRAVLVELDPVQRSEPTDEVHVDDAIHAIIRVVAPAILHVDGFLARVILGLEDFVRRRLILSVGQALNVAEYRHPGVRQPAPTAHLHRQRALAVGGDVARVNRERRQAKDWMPRGVRREVHRASERVPSATMMHVAHRRAQIAVIREFHQVSRRRRHRGQVAILGVSAHHPPRHGRPQQPRSPDPFPRTRALKRYLQRLVLHRPRRRLPARRRLHPRVFRLARRRRLHRALSRARRPSRARLPFHAARPPLIARAVVLSRAFRSRVPRGRPVRASSRRARRRRVRARRLRPRASSSRRPRARRRDARGRRRRHRARAVVSRRRSPSVVARVAESRRIAANRGGNRADVRTFGHSDMSI